MKVTPSRKWKVIFLDSSDGILSFGAAFATHTLQTNATRGRTWSGKPRASRSPWKPPSNVMSVMSSGKKQPLAEYPAACWQCCRTVKSPCVFVILLLISSNPLSYFSYQSCFYGWGKGHCLMAEQTFGLWKVPGSIPGHCHFKALKLKEVSILITSSLLGERERETFASSAARETLVGDAMDQSQNFLHTKHGSQAKVFPSVFHLRTFSWRCLDLLHAKLKCSATKPFFGGRRRRRRKSNQSLNLGGICNN